MANFWGSPYLHSCQIFFSNLDTTSHNFGADVRQTRKPLIILKPRFQRNGVRQWLRRNTRNTHGGIYQSKKTGPTLKRGKEAESIGLQRMSLPAYVKQTTTSTVYSTNHELKHSQNLCQIEPFSMMIRCSVSKYLHLRMSAVCASPLATQKDNRRLPPCSTATST